MMRCVIRPYRHYGDCIVADNGIVEVILSLGFGPRILSFRLLEHENVFYEQPANATYLCSSAGWRVYGGTRLWLAPECMHDDYFPDNAPVEYAILEDGVRVTQPRDKALQIEKSITVRFTDEPNTVAVAYEIKNIGAKPLFGAPWAVSMMQKGARLTARYAGVALGAKPGAFLTLWNKTSLSDPRLTLDSETFTLRQTPDDAYFKLGALCRAGEARCEVAGQSFTKRFAFEEDAAYPDNNVNLEAYACLHMLEFETLAPLRTIAPGETAEHAEIWALQRIMEA